MTGLVALKAAYAVTWIIPLAYLSYLYSRYRRACSEMKDLKRSS